MNFTVIIPARYASSRLPGKPLRLIGNKSMLEHVYNRAQESEASRIIIATDHEEIKAVAESFSAEVVLTSVEHNSGTDRLQEVVSQLALSDEELVVNVQGDEPLLPAGLINQVAQNLNKNLGADCATLCEKIHSLSDCLNPNIVKVVLDNLGFALYFSRAPIPWDREQYANLETNQDQNLTVSVSYRHIGIYAYRVGVLNRFVTWDLAELEKVEKLEQLRILANAGKIHVDVASAVVPGGVDTEEDLLRVTQLMEANS